MRIDLTADIALRLKLADQIPNRLLAHPDPLGQDGDAGAVDIKVRQQIRVRQAQPGVAALAQLGERLQAVAALRVQEQAANVLLAQRLDGGTRAPDFRAADLFGNPIELAAYQGGPLLLTFLRNAACALCNLRVRRLSERYADYRRAGLEVVAVFESAADSMRQYVGRQDAPFLLIADPEARLYALYGVESSEAKIAATLAMPATQQQIAAAAAQGFPLTEEAGSNFLVEEQSNAKNARLRGKIGAVTTGSGSTAHDCHAERSVSEAKHLAGSAEQ